jgi:hypothetical protein
MTKGRLLRKLVDLLYRGSTASSPEKQSADVKLSALQGM